MMSIGIHPVPPHASRRRCRHGRTTSSVSSATSGGEDLIEYGLLAAFVAAVATAVIIADPLGIKGSLKNAFNRAKTALDAS